MCAAKENMRERIGFMSTTDEKNTTEFSQDDRKKLKQFKIADPLQQLGSGVEKSYFSTFVSYLYTNIYVMPAAFSGIITIVQQIVGWIGSPVFGTIIDKVSFKNAKYYPWMIIGPLIVYLDWLLIFCLPMFGITGSTGAACALILSIINACAQPLVTVPATAVYPNLSSDPADRQYFARMQKIARDGGKTVFGYIFPVLLPMIALAASNGAQEATARGEAISYGVCAIIAGIIPIVTYIFYALCLKGSYVERNAMKKPAGRKKSLPVTVMFKNIFTNRPLLSMYLFMGLHKSYYFIYTSCATYIFKYVFNDFSKMSIFMTVFNLTAIIGVMFGPLWRKIFKETKRCFVSAMAVHVVLLVVIALTFSASRMVLFIALFAFSSLFMGLLENYILPMFAAAADYGAWKSGQRMDGLSMSVFALTIKTGTLVSATLRTAVLVAANLDAITAGGPVTAQFISYMSAFWTWVPVGLAVLSLLCLVFLFNLNDTRIKNISSDLKAGIVAANSQYKF